MYARPRQLGPWAGFALLMVAAALLTDLPIRFTMHLAVPHATGGGRFISLFELLVLLVGLSAALAGSSRLASWEASGSRDLSGANRRWAALFCLAPALPVLAIMAGPIWASEAWDTPWTQWAADRLPFLLAMAGTMVTFAALGLVVTAATNRWVGPGITLLVYLGLVWVQSREFVWTRYLPFHGYPNDPSRGYLAALGLAGVCAVAATVLWDGGGRRRAGGRGVARPVA